MQLFFHDVGLKGSNRDFPKTVFGDIPLSLIEQHAPPEIKSEMISLLGGLFPDGVANVWGVPAGAASVIKRLQADDVMLLVRTTGGEGDIPALCKVKAYWQYKMLDLSTSLWGEAHFPYIFFFETEPITLTWRQFRADVGYQSNFRPAGQVYRVQETRLTDFGGASGYLTRLRTGQHLQPGQLTAHVQNLPKQTANTDYIEGKRLTKERSYFTRNPKLVEQAKAAYGYICYVCSFNFAAKYGGLGTEYIECHHLNPLSERDDSKTLQTTSISEVRMVCSNCHRMLHRTRPAMDIDELKAIVAMSPYP